MASYKLFFKRSAEKELRRISEPDLRRVVQRIQSLSHQPRPPGAQMLKGQGKDWRIRQGDYRVIYEVNDSAQEVSIIKIGHRRDVYN